MKELDVLYYAIQGVSTTACNLSEKLVEAREEEEKQFFRDCLASVDADRIQIEKQIKKLEVKK